MPLMLAAPGPLPHRTQLHCFSPPPQVPFGYTGQVRPARRFRAAGGAWAACAGVPGTCASAAALSRVRTAPRPPAASPPVHHDLRRGDHQH
jgi:hypothetical protein